MIDFFIMDASVNERYARKSETAMSQARIKHISGPAAAAFAKDARESQEDSLDNEFETF